MATADLASLTVEEFLALPEDGVDRELIRGELREGPMTYRNQYHSESMGAVAETLRVWRRASGLDWRILVGDAGFVLKDDPQTVVGIDVAVVDRSRLQSEMADRSIIIGAPVLAVEILSPSDTVEHIHERTELFIESGVAVVWWLDPRDRTVRVYRPNQVPVLLNESQDLTGEPELPGLRVAVAELFE